MNLQLSQLSYQNIASFALFKGGFDNFTSLIMCSGLIFKISLLYAINILGEFILEFSNPTVY